MIIDKCYYINLKKRLDRKVYIEKEFQKSKLLKSNMQRFNAVDGKYINPRSVKKELLTENAINDILLDNVSAWGLSMTQGGLGVFSEIYYPKGWTATIDGKEAPILRVNYLLRGLELPAGDSEVVFTFAPDSYYLTKTPMVIFQYLIVLALIAGLFFTYKESHAKS